jgi:arylsulfatase A-like enzyme
MRPASAALLLVAFGPPLAAAEPPARRPNVVLILADDLGSADLGVQGCADIPTPHLDALARSGVRCTSGYVSHPFCSPTRAGLMTGRYQQRFGHENNPAYLPDDPAVGLPTDQVTMADVLARAGYATGWVGKWHLGAEPRFRPSRRGFREGFGFLGGGHDYFQETGDLRPPEYRIALLRDDMPLEAEPDYLTDAFTREAVAFIERHRADPFFLYLAYNAVHTPLQAPSAYLDRVKGITDAKRRPYAAMLLALDDGVGRVLEALKRHGLERDTLVVFLSDNGGPPTANGSSNAPLRGAKGALYEGGIRVPFFVRWPARLPAGATYDQPVIALDLWPTFAAAAGATVPDGVTLDGVDLLPYLSGERPSAPHEVLHWRADGGTRFALRKGDRKLVRQAPDRVELFDLAADPGESRDLAAARPAEVEALNALHDRWNAELVPPRWSNPRPAAAAKTARAKAARKAARPARNPRP